MKRATGGALDVVTGDGQPEAFEDFYRREYQRGVRLAWLITRSTPASEDLVQDAMLSVHAVFDRLDSPSAYLCRAVMNRGRTWRRDQARDSQEIQRLLWERPPLPPEEGELFEAISTLPYRQKVVIVTRYWLGWSEREIADFLDCRLGTVKSLGSRAIAHLRTNVKGA